MVSLQSRYRQINLMSDDLLIQNPIRTSNFSVFFMMESYG